MNNKLKTAIVTVAMLATLAACSSSKSSDSAGDAADSSSPATANSTQATVQVDQDIKDALNVEAGSAVIPGSIDSVAQELGEVCTKAVAPIRENYITKFPSLRQVTDMVAFNKEWTDARVTCETDSAQEWSDFYTKEFAGWMTAKTDDAVENAGTTVVPETTVAP